MGEFLFILKYVGLVDNGLVDIFYTPKTYKEINYEKD